jgi:hypothetical protein
MRLISSSAEASTSPVTEKITLRPTQFECLLTRFGNDFTKGNNNQSNFRYQAGVQFRS